MTDPTTLIGDTLKQFIGGNVTFEEIAEVFANWGTALLSVIDLHAPMPNIEKPWCMHCSDGETTEPWPCPTVRKITTILEGK